MGHPSLRGHGCAGPLSAPCPAPARLWQPSLSVCPVSRCCRAAVLQPMLWAGVSFRTVHKLSLASRDRGSLQSLLCPGFCPSLQRLVARAARAV